MEQAMWSLQGLLGPLLPCSASIRIGTIPWERSHGGEACKGNPHALFEQRGEETEAIALSSRAPTRRAKAETPGKTRHVHRAGPRLHDRYCDSEDPLRWI
jgi:hypothetical protein